MGPPEVNQKMRKRKKRRKGRRRKGRQQWWQEKAGWLVYELDSLWFGPIIRWPYLLWGLQSLHNPQHLLVFLPLCCALTLVGLMTFNVRFKGMGCYHSRYRTTPTWDRMEPGDPNWKAGPAGGKNLMDLCQPPLSAWCLPVGKEPELGREVWGSETHFIVALCKSIPPLDFGLTIC